MKQIYRDLWVTEPEHPLPELPDLMMHAYLLVRQTGNILFCRSEHHADHRHIRSRVGLEAGNTALLLVYDHRRPSRTVSGTPASRSR